MTTDEELYGPRPEGCCGVCPAIAGGGYDCTCEDNPHCPRFPLVAGNGRIQIGNGNGGL